MKDQDYKQYLFEYFHDGANWCITVHATSPEDAQARMNKMPLARYLGIVEATIPAALPGSGLLVRVWCWWKNLGIAGALLLATAAQAAAPWPIVYVEQPGAGSQLPDASSPGPKAHSKIVRLDPDGKRTVLVDPGPTRSAWDPMPSLDGKWVYYADAGPMEQRPDLTITRLLGSDIWRVNVETLAKERLTNNSQAAPYGGRSPRPWAAGLWNMGPCPLADRLIFTSDREIPGQHQLWSCDLDGKNVEKTGFLNLQSALHPMRLSNGRVLFSTNEGQGMRISITWGQWTVLPDGRDFEPFFSAYWAATSLHFAGEAANKQVVTTAYYASQANDGFGAFFAAPIDFPGYEHKTPLPAGSDQQISKLFLPKLGYELTPWTHPWDTASPQRPDGTFVGKVSHPAPCPDPTKILCSYSPGPVNRGGKPTSTPLVQSGIYLMPIGAPTTGPEQLVKVVDDPNAHEYQAQPLVPYATLFPSHPQAPLPKPESWLPNDGTEHLPAGTPYALIGTASLYTRETDTLVAGRTSFSPIGLQGGNAKPFNNSEIAKIRILTMEWPTGSNPNLNSHETNLAGEEKLRILGEVDVRRFDATGNRIKDPAGNPDTSFLARIRADEPFTFQLIDSSGSALSMSQTWHHVRPGERKHDCRGCHAHTAPETRFEFEQSWAAKNPPADFTTVNPRLVEFKRDVKPILTARGIPFDDSTPAKLHDGLGLFYQVYSFDSKSSKLVADLKAASATAAEIRTVSEWYDTGGLIDLGDAFRDETKPTLFIHSPRRGAPPQPITKVIVSAADAQLQAGSLRVSLNGQPLSMTPAGDGIWEAVVPAVSSGIVTASVADVQGNVTRQERVFGDVPAPPLFVKTDTTTKGTWKGVYGADGFAMAGSTTSLPASVQLTLSGQDQHVWAATTQDPRALQKPTGTDRIMAAWYSGGSFNLNLKLADLRQVALYCVDEQPGPEARKQFVDIIDPTTNAVVDSREVADFAGGKWLVWNLSGDVQLRVSRVAGANAVLSGIFFGPVTATQPPLPVRNTKAVYIGRPIDLIGAGRSTTPDGVPDHRISLTGVGAWNRCIVKDKNGAFTWSNEAEIPLAMMRPGQGVANPTGLSEINFNPHPGSEALTEWVVYLRYPDGTEDQIATTLPPTAPPPPSGPTANELKYKAALESINVTASAALAP